MTARRLALALSGACLRWSLVAIAVGGGAPASRADESPTARAPAPPVDPAVERLLRDARETAAKDVGAALPKYFAALREALDYGTKYAIRDEVLALPLVAPPPITVEERATVAARIAEERERDVSRKADGFEGRGWLHASRRLHGKVMDLDAIADERRKEHEKAVERIERRLCDEATEAERAEARTIEGDLDKPEAAMAAARKAFDEGRPRVALRVLRAVATSSIPDAATREKAAKEAEALRRRIVEEISEEERTAADAVWDDPHWRGLSTNLSQEFVYIGAKAFVDSLQPADRLKLDLACVFLGDLVGRDMTEDGERLTIYYKERFDFGGGLASGKRIDIGKGAIGTPVADPLHFHELSHCVFDVGMIYPGFLEGIANFGAVFALDAMGRAVDADATIRKNRESYRADYRERRLAYFRIQSYAPSCGFLLTPITANDARARQAEWRKYRYFFRTLRGHGQHEPRDAERIRRFVYHWADVFGWDLLDEAAKARFPVGREIRDHVPEEEREWSAATERGERLAFDGLAGAALEPLEAVERAHAGTELADRARFAIARCRQELGDDAARDAIYADLGVVSTWKICGPFYSRHLDPLLEVYEPERSIDLAATYPNPVEVARWKDAKNGPDGRIDLRAQGIEYCDHAVCYVLAWIEVPADEPTAVVRTGFDDKAALWVDGELVEKWSDRSHEWVFDQHTAAVPLKAGRHRFLFKVANDVGAWAFSARIARADRTPISGMKVVDPPAKDVPGAPPPAKGHAVYLEDFANDHAVPKGRLHTTAGSFDVAAKVLRRERGGNVLWRKFLIAPYVSHDPPSALAWLHDKDLLEPGAFAFEVSTRRADEGTPRLAVTLHGEERDDGLSGHTFILRPGGEGLVCDLEEYDRSVYQATIDLPKAADHVFRFVRRGRTLSCLVDGRVVLPEVDLPPLPRSGIGFMTWDRETGISRLRVERIR